MSWASDLATALKGPTGWPVWVVTAVGIAFVVWRGLVPVGLGNTSEKRVHPRRAALGIAGGVMGLGFLVTYTLARILERLAETLGWEKMGKPVAIRCFTNEPSIASSLKFLRRTPWARAKVEALYVADVRRRAR